MSLSRILAEQREAAASLPAPGAVLGVSDWVAEEVLTMSEITTWESYRDRIAARWSEGVEAFLDCGRLLIAAKASLPRGEWGKLFSDGAMPFGERTAQRLMAIAAHPTLANPTRVSHLPPAWSTLHELSRLPAAECERLIEAGEIHPEMTRADATALRSREAIDAEGKRLADAYHASMERFWAVEWPEMVETKIQDIAEFVRYFDALPAAGQQHVLEAGVFNLREITTMRRRLRNRPRYRRMMTRLMRQRWEAHA